MGSFFSSLSAMADDSIAERCVKCENFELVSELHECDGQKYCYNCWPYKPERPEREYKPNGLILAKTERCDKCNNFEHISWLRERDGQKYCHNC